MTRAKRQEHGAREARLAKALRENLRRRKQQARSRAASDAPVPSFDTQPEDGSAAG